MDNIKESYHFIYLHIKDTLAIVFSNLIISFSVIILKQSGALTGSTSGIAFLISYVSPLSFSSSFFLINLPFYLLSFNLMGLEFTLKTFFSVGLVSIFTYMHPLFVHFSAINPFYAILLSNIIASIGFIILFHHKTSFGGINILSLWLQNRLGINFVKLQMFIDAIVMLISFFIVSLPILLTSVIGSTILNYIIMLYSNSKNKILK
ncbi:MAG: YitT family protein [Pantoea sp. Brub]|nr:YitT family protein [Pantoea sp. Brub]